MWANVNAQSVHQQNAVSLMQVDMLQLGVLQTQMDNLSVQATLLIGFALSMWGGATLKPLLEDDSQICIWKTWYHLAFAAVFFVTIALCISCGGIIVTLVLYIKQAAQESALLVSTGAAVANTRRHLSSLNRLFVVSYASFALSAVLLIVLYVGMPARIPTPYPALERAHMNDHTWGSELESLVTRFDGVPTITCLDPRSPASHYNRFAYGAAIAATNTLIIVCMSAWGYRLYAVIRRSYMHDELLHWFVGQQAEQKRRAERLSRAVQLQRGVTCDSTG